MRSLMLVSLITTVMAFLMVSLVIINFQTISDRHEERVEHLAAIQLDSAPEEVQCRITYKKSESVPQLLSSH